MTVLACINQKGGVGKSTTCANLSIGMAKKDQRVLVIDCDPQGTITDHLGYRDRKGLTFTLRNAMESVILKQELPPEHGLLHCKEGVDLLPANTALAEFEPYLSTVMEREYVLQDYISKVKPLYDHIYIDGPPSLGVLSINILAAADKVIIPVQAEYSAVIGLTDMLSTIGSIKRRINPSLEIEGIVFTMVDNRVRISRETMRQLREAYGEHIHVFETEIPYSVRIKEANQNAQSIYTFEPLGKGALAYEQLTKEVLSNGCREKTQQKQQTRTTPAPPTR